MTEPAVEQVAAPEHRCAVPELELGKAWQCPEPGCGLVYGQQLGPDQEVVNAGQVLHDLATAFIEAGHALADGVPPRQVQAAFYRIGGQLQRTAHVAAQINVAVPRRG